MNPHEVLEQKPEERRWVKMVNGIEIPMTEEEISQRLAEEEQWEREKENHKVTPLIPPEGYEIRLVAFIDILGWKKLIKKSKTDINVFKKLWNAIKSIQSTAQVNYAFSDHPLSQPPRYDIAEVSDSIVISVKIEKGLTNSIYAIQEIRSIISILLQYYGLICRGGITIGPVIHERNMIFGPALLDAIDLERQANVPRIIVADFIMGDIFNTLYCNRDGSLIRKAKDVRQDAEDGRWFVNYLSPMFSSESEHRRLPLYREKILELINDPDNQQERLRVKYQWLVNYFNSILGEYPETGLEPLVLPF